MDAHVAQHLMEQCVNGLLAGKTRVLVTHAARWIGTADHLCVLGLEPARVVRRRGEERSFDDALCQCRHYRKRAEIPLAVLH